MPKLNTAITVAIITAAAGIGAAIIGNWDKIFPPKSFTDDKKVINVITNQTQPSEVEVNWADIDTPSAPGYKVAAAPRLHDYGISIKELIPQDSQLVFINNLGLYNGEGVNPSDTQNILRQVNTGTSACAYTLEFSKPCFSVSFTIPAFFAETSSGVTHPAWKATAYDSEDNELDSHAEGLLRKFTNVPKEIVTLRAPGFTGISFVRFDSDYRLNGKPFAAFESLLIEKLSYVPMDNGNH
jgi:hypothetical protein